MPSFRTSVRVVLDGETLEFRTRADDHLNAERTLGRSPADSPLEFGMRVHWTAFKRTFPDHPAAKTFGRYVEALDASDELEPEGSSPDDPGPLDPTLEAGSDS